VQTSSATPDLLLIQ